MFQMEPSARQTTKVGPRMDNNPMKLYTKTKLPITTKMEPEMDAEFQLKSQTEHGLQNGHRQPVGGCCSISLREPSLKARDKLGNFEDALQEP